jgi:heat shock protein HslJ
MARISLLAASAPLVLAACASGHDRAPSNPLADTTWHLEALKSNEDSIGVVRPDDSSKYEMHLAADGSVAMRLDCNRGVGRWEWKGPNQIRFSQLAMTRAMCLGNSLDTRVAREMEAMVSYVLDGDRLTLNMKMDSGDQVWTRVSG